MALIVVLAALAIQRFLKFNSYSRRFDWASHYFKWMHSKFRWITEGHGLVGLAILVVPVVLFAAVVFGVVYGVLGFVGYTLLNLVVVWYCFDGRDLRKEPYDNATPSLILLNCYEHLFAMMFWYCLFGAIGLLLYFSIVQINAVLIQPINVTSGDDQEVERIAALQHFFATIQGLLDWVPVRLLGLSFALVGDFSTVFKAWLQKFSEGIANPRKLVLEWGGLAVKSASVGGDDLLEPVIDLLDRSLLVWLAAIFLVTLGLLLG